MNFGAFSSNLQPLNAIEELNSYYNVAGEQDLRSALFDIQQDDANDVGEVEEPPPSDPELENIANAVQQGREKLQTAILDYHKSKMAYDAVVKEYTDLCNNVRTIEASLGMLKHACFENVQTLISEAASHALDDCRTRRDAHHNDMKFLQQKLSQMREVFRILKNSDTTFACPVCLKQQVECFLIPCGHTYCNNCISKASSTCFICRQRFHNISNLFFS